MKTYTLLRPAEDGKHFALRLHLTDDDTVWFVELDQVDIDAAIEAEGWCGTYVNDIPVVILEGTNSDIPPEAKAYLTQWGTAW